MFSIGLNGYSKGLGIASNFSKETRQIHNNIYSLELGNIRHPKEIDIINSFIPNSTAYAYGKVNRAYVFRGLAGRQYCISDRRDRKSIALLFNIQTGISAAYIAPVYVDLLVVDNSTAYYRPTRYNPEVHPQFLIGGRSGFNYGLGEGDFVPGLHFRLGLEAQWGNYQNDFKSLGCGLMVDAFSRKLPLLYGPLNQQVFSAFYLTFALGSNY